jgi:hypothetical protein
MNWRPYPYIALAFFSRRMVQLQLLSMGLFCVAIGAALLGGGAARTRLGPHFRVNWEHEWVTFPKDQRLELDRTGLMAPQASRANRMVSYLSLMNSSKGDDGRSIQFLPEPLGRDEMARVVARFPALRSLKIWGHVSAEGWAGLAGADRLEHLEIQDGTGAEMSSLETLPHLPALRRIITRIGSSATLLKGLGRNNPQVRQLMLSDIYITRRGQNLPVFPLEGLTNLEEIAIHPSSEPAEGEQLFAKWDPQHSVLSKGHRLSPPSEELLTALKALPKLKRVYCCDWSAGDWGVAEIRDALGWRVAVEQGTVVRARNAGPPFAAMAVTMPMFFLAFLLTFQAGATFSHELSQTVPDYSRPHLVAFGGSFLALTLVFALLLNTQTGHWGVSAAYALFLSATTAVAFGGTQLQLKPKWIVSLLQKAFLPLLVVVPFAPVLSQLGRDRNGEPPHWLVERALTLVVTVASPPPLLVALALGIGVTCGLWYFGSLPRLAGRMQSENARGGFDHPFDQGRTSAAWPNTVQGPQTPTSWTLGNYPKLEAPSVPPGLLGPSAASDRLEWAFGQGQSSGFVQLWPFVVLTPGIAIWYRQELAAGDLLGGLLIPLTRLGLIAILSLISSRQALAVARRPYCPYEAILPLSRGDYHTALESLYWRKLVAPSAWAALWCGLGAVFTLWRSGGERPLDVLFFHGLLGVLVGALAFAASEFGRWAITVRSHQLVMFLGFAIGMVLLQIGFMTTLFGQMTGDGSTTTVIALVLGNVGAFAVGMTFYVVNAHRYRSLEWGKLG